jgi:DNA (cytosine-5)-methyltransferase 1
MEGLLKPTTVANILSQVPLEIEPHMAATVDWKVARNAMPYNANRPLQGAITTNGGEANLHPNGERPFNLQELAQLQGFPASHIFVGRKRSIMRQIGNAVPGKAVTPYFREIKKCLEEFDEEVDEYLNEIIVID